jgi:hypothetical protein
LHFGVYVGLRYALFADDAGVVADFEFADGDASIGEKAPAFVGGWLVAVAQAQIGGDSGVL